MYAFSISILFLLFIQQCSAIECYTGLKLIAGQSIGTETIQCDNSNAYCYNMTANAASVIDVFKTGCSMWRCMLARDKCISTVFQNIPISLCCCSSNKCNVSSGENGIQKKITGGWNKTPEQQHGTTAKKEWTKEEVAEKFKTADLDDDLLIDTTRGNRHSTQGEIQIP